MTSEVRMPQLGMNQDRAAILAWRAQIGDRVEAGDILYEVETDKAAMEIEAGKAGYLAEIRVAAGTEIPVGEVIAVIVEKEADIPACTASQDSDPPPADQPASTKTAAPPPSSKTTDPPPPSGEPAAPAPPMAQPGASRVLASPKARRLASRRGIDLVALRDRGVAEPIHVADLPAIAAARQSALEARVDAAAFDALASRAANSTQLLAAFAAGAWRTRLPADDVSVAILGMDGKSAVHANPDHGGRGEAGAPVLTLIDLGQTRVTSCLPARDGVTLSSGRDGDVLVLTLSFDADALPLPEAIAFLDSLAARVEDPIRQLL